MQNDFPSSAGFSLVELMISAAVFGLITAQLLGVLSNQKRVYSSNERVLDVQEQARLTLELISYDTRMAGFMVPLWSAVSSVDGGANGADRLCVSDASYFDFSGAASPLDSKTVSFNGASVTGVFSDHVTVSSLDIDGTVPADEDFLRPSAVGAGNGGGIIISSPTQTFCARITKITAGNNIYFEDHDTDDTVEYGNATKYITAGVTAQLRAVPAQIYEVDQDPTVLELHRNGLLLATSIEDLQVEYWLDNAGTPNGVQDGDDEFPVNKLNNPDPPGGAIPADMARVRRVRISVLARTETGEGDDSAHGRLLGGKPALANRLAPAATDEFRRRSFSASILPRNLVAVGDN
jgi:prepilin-type N-terminal cleavage/methylation domain-containing protein